MNLFKSYKNKLGGDTFTIQINFFDGSLANINYLSNGHKGYPKEKLEIFFDGKVILLDNFKRLKSWGLSKNIKKYSFSQMKGQKECISAFLDSLRGISPSPISIDEIFEVHKYLLDFKI